MRIYNQTFQKLYSIDFFVFYKTFFFNLKSNLCIYYIHKIFKKKMDKDLIDNESAFQKLIYNHRRKKVRVIIFHKGSHKHIAKEYLSQFNDLKIVDLDEDIYTYIEKDRRDELKEKELSDKNSFENIMNPIKEKILKWNVHNSRKGFKFVVVLGSNYRMFRNFGINHNKIVSLIPDGNIFGEISKGEDVMKDREQIMRSGVITEYYKDINELQKLLISFLSLRQIGDKHKKK